MAKDKDKDKKKSKKKDKAKGKLGKSDFLKEVKSKKDEIKSKRDKKKLEKEKESLDKEAIEKELQEKEAEVKKGLSQQAEAVKTAVTNAAASVGSVASNAAASVGSVASNAAANVSNVASNAAASVTNAASNITREIGSKVAKHSTTPQLESFEMPDDETLFNLANLFKIFSDPTRLRILFSLVDGPRCVADISEAAGVTQGATSHQLRSMKQEHLVDFERDGKQVFYSLADNRVQTLLAQGLSYIGE